MNNHICKLALYNKKWEELHNDLFGDDLIR